MGLTVTTNFNGSVSEVLYEVIGVGNEVIQKGAAFLETNVAEKKELSFISTAVDPWGTWVATPVTGGAGDTSTTTQAKRDLTVSKMMIYEEFSPDDYLQIWEIFRAAGNMTNMSLNPTILRAVLNVIASAAGTQLSKVFFQGDTGGAAALAFFDGIVKFMLADGNVTDIATSGAITKANVIAVLEKVWAGIPNHLIDDPDFKILMSTTDWKFLQQANIDAKKTTVGVLTQQLENMYNNHQIQHFSGLLAGSIIGAVVSNSERSNLVMGVYFDLENEMNSVRIGRISEASEDWFLRINMKAGAQYRYGGDMLLYQPA